MNLLMGHEFWWLSHDDSGRPLMAAKTHSVSLASALLAELLVEDKIVIQPDGTVGVTAVSPPVDALAHRVLDSINDERTPHPVGIWLQFFARTAYEDVAQRMVRKQLISPREERRVFRGPITRYEPLNRLEAVRIRSKLYMSLLNQRVLQHSDAFLLALAAAASLDTHVLDGAGHQARAYMQYLIDNLPDPLLTLARHTRTVVGGKVLSGRA